MKCNHEINKHTIEIRSFTESKIPKRNAVPPFMDKGHCHIVSCRKCFHILVMFDTSLDGKEVTIV